MIIKKRAPAGAVRLRRRRPARRPDNGGFSLIELLVAIVILSVVFGIISHAFITSTRLTRRSHDRGNDTLAIQNVLEMVRVEGFAGMRKMINGGVTSGNMGDYGSGTIDPLSSVIPGDDDFSELVYDIRNFTAGGSFYDVRLRMNSVPFDGIFNDIEYTDFIDMTGVHFQPSNSIIAPNIDPDSRADQAILDLGFDLDSVRREITIKFERDASNVEIWVRYDYYLTFLNDEGEFESDYFNPIIDSLEYRIKSYPYTIDASNNIIDEINNVYICIRPYHSTNRDIINILYIGEPVECNLYLVIQDDPSADRNHDNYSPTVVHHSLGLTVPRATLFSNFKAGTTYINGSFYNNVIVYWHDDGTVQHGLYYYTSPDTSYVSKDIIPKRTITRMYEVTVELFRQGQNFHPDALLMTTPATHLER
jgi:prepilin-type N-terminal cleavage/methylation domain-containing protein